MDPAQSFGVLALRRFFGLSVVALGGVALYVVSLAVGGGWMMQHAVVPVRWLTNLHRRLAARWAGVEIAEPYRSMPPLPEPGPDGRYQWGRQLYDSPRSVVRMQRYSWALRDPATWRDLAWLVTAPVAGLLILAAPAVFAFGFFGLIWQPLWWPLWGSRCGWPRAPGSHLVHVARTGRAGAAARVGAGTAEPAGRRRATGVGLVAAAPLRGLYARWAKLLLAPTERARLALRVQRLTETRADATDAQAAELRRIERDLHDGAQARLVAMGMTLGAIEHLLDKDPAAARALLAETRESSAKALSELVTSYAASTRPCSPNADSPTRCARWRSTPRLTST